MDRVASRTYTQPSRTGWYLLLSLLVHLLAVAALNLPWQPWEEFQAEPKPQRQDPIQVSFVRPENTEEPEKPEAFAETSSKAQAPEGPKAEVTESPETILPREQQLPALPPPSPAPEVRQEAQPQAVQPPAEVTPKPAPDVAPKRSSPPPRRQDAAKATPPKADRAPAERPESKRLAKLPEPVERVPQRPTPKQAPDEAPEPKRLAKLPEPAERSPRRPPPEPISPPRLSFDSPLPPGQAALPRMGRIPLLSGEDLEKYAQVRSSNRQSSSGGDVSLDTKELKYLSYFAHIKRRIERVWTYPQDAIASGSQGQLHLKFVLQRNGQVKTVELLRSSGVKALDKEAWNAVVNAGPFESFPPTIPDDELHITARFSYVLDEAAQRIRMR